MGKQFSITAFTLMGGVPYLTTAHPARGPNTDPVGRHRAGHTNTYRRLTPDRLHSTAHPSAPIALAALVVTHPNPG
jgi:hypothetical protein